MNTEPQAAHEAPLNRPVAALPVMKTLLWSVRRELWEHRSIYIAPLAAAVVFLAGFLVSLIKWRITPSIHSAQYAMPYEFVAGLIMGTAFIVGIFYSLDTLYGERRDRSI